MVDGDAERLAQVVANLLTNAAKYTDPGGSITLSAQRHDDRVTISVRDNGQGIAADLLPQIFDLFVQGERRSDRAPGGLGIGLALVRNIVELHGGRVEARSAGPGMGSELVIDLQAAPDAVATPQVPGPEPAPPPGRPIGRILVVDDNVDAASTLADALQMVGYEVVVAHDGPQALAAASELPATTALIDIGLPVMDGYELARLLRRQWTGQPLQLIAVTGYGQESDKENAKSAGFDAHLVKPVRLPDLLALLSPAAAQDD
jgi:CheY-like chemotaxis protein